MLPVTVPVINNAQFEADKLRFLQLHAIPLYIAWMILVPIAILIVPFGSKWNKWFPVHITLIGLAVVATIIGSVAGILHSEGRHLGHPHRILGVTVLSVLFLQIILGIVISLLYKRERVKPPFFDKVHWWLGRLLVLLAFVTIFVGLLWVKVDLWIYIVTGSLQLVFTIAYCILIIIFP